MKMICSGVVVIRLAISAKGSAAYIAERKKKGWAIMKRRRSRVEMQEIQGKCGSGDEIQEVRKSFKGSFRVHIRSVHHHSGSSSCMQNPLVLMLLQLLCCRCCMMK